MNKLSRVFQRSTLAYALLYVVLSIGIEAVAMVVFRLRPPAGNAILAPIALIVPPLLTPWLAGYRRGWYVALAALTAALTLALTVAVTHFTKNSTGLLTPIVVRGLAGWLAAVLTHKFS